ncbi:MAG TPA: cell surface protein, partial [Planctomycetota bacterium]|nr:cell surface protein [Planctomycetota bacterium]
MKPIAVLSCGLLALTVGLLSAWSQRPLAEARGGPLADAGTAVYFTTDVMPLLNRFGCNTAACHGSSQGKGGLRLSLFGAYPREDYEAITRSAPGRRVNTVAPQASLLLLKATGGLPHEGAR